MINSNKLQQEVYGGYLNKLKNRFYGLLCEREKLGEWKKFLDTLTIELMGFPEESRTINYYSLVYKLSTLKYLEYEYFRKTIFECMNLIDSLEVGDDNGLL